MRLGISNNKTSKNETTKKKVGRVIFTLLVGLAVATFSYRWITDPSGREERALQESVVEVSRQHLAAAIGNSQLEVVDPLSPNRKVGKVYVYPENDAWAVSGYYRRDDSDEWHPYLMSIDAALAMISLKAKDDHPSFLERAGTNPLLEVAD